jgi:hypothetical protein
LVHAGELLKGSERGQLHRSQRFGAFSDHCLYCSGVERVLDLLDCVRS